MLPQAAPDALGMPRDPRTMPTASNAGTNAQPWLHVVVTCSNRKNAPIPVQLRLGELRERRPRLRFATWTRRLAADVPAAHPAIDLYAGEHWQVARGLTGSLAGRPTQVWVASAGYGLITVDTPVRPYSATFSPAQPDSVGTSRTEVEDWWTRLSTWRGPAAGLPRSIAELADRWRDATIVAVLSASYQRACAADLLAASDRLHSSDQLSVVGPPACRDLADLLVPVGAGLQHAVGGSRQALNVRAAAHLLHAATASGDLRRPGLRHIAAALPARTDYGRPPGRRLTDDQVRAYIDEHIREGAPPTSATKLLRQLRASGRSCEQARFGRLYAAIASGRSRCQVR